MDTFSLWNILAQVQNFFFSYAKLINAIQFPRISQCNTPILHETNTWTEASKSMHLFRHSVTIHSSSQKVKEADWIWKIFLVRKEHKPKAPMCSKGERGVVGSKLKPLPTLRLGRQFIFPKGTFPRSSEQHGQIGEISLRPILWTRKLGQRMVDPRKWQIQE